LDAVVEGWLQPAIIVIVKRNHFAMRME
jgi:hypothetical protein